MIFACSPILNDEQRIAFQCEGGWAGLWWRKPGPGLQRSQHSPLRRFTCQLFSGPTADPLQPPIRGAFRNVQRASGGPQRCLGESKQRWRTGGREGATTGPRRSINC